MIGDLGAKDATELAGLVASGMIEPREIEEITATGGAGEMLGHFFDALGREVEEVFNRG